MKKAVVIIPTFNENENIQKVVPVLSRVFEKISSWDMHVLVVDDNSPDHTADAVKELQKKYAFLHLLVNNEKAGLGSAYLKGMAKAFGELGADIVFEFDADLSHNPEKIPDFLAKIDDGYDMVVGSRYIPGGGIPQHWGFHRKFLSVVGNWVIRLILTDFRLHDWTTGYRAITKAVYKAVSPELQSEQFSSYTFQTGFLHKTVKKGFKVAEVPFVFVDREIGESKLGFESITDTFSYICRVRIQEIMASRIFKFAFVGGVGAVTQLISLQVWRALTIYEVATFLSIETAVLSNFILNNFWTFADRRPSLSQYPLKFIQFNLASAGSILIQYVIALGGKFIFGLHPLFTLPLIHKSIDTGTVYAVVGILIGMFWNFFAYSRFVWKKK